MSQVLQTTPLERCVLKIVLTNQMLCRMHIHSLNDDLFSSRERKFIFKLAFNTFQESKSLLTKPLFEYEVGAKISEPERPFYLGEWEVINGQSEGEDLSALIAKIIEVNVGRKVLGIIENVSDLLMQGRISDAVSRLKSGSVSVNVQREDKPVVRLADYEQREKLIQDKKNFPEKYLGIKTGFYTFDRHTGGLFPGELTLIAGLTGAGKSTFVRQLQIGIVSMASNGAKNVLHIANEEYLEQVQFKFDAAITGIPYLDFKLARIEDEELARWKEQMQDWREGNKNGHVFIKEVPAFTDITLVEQTVRELEFKGIPIHVVIVDHLPHVKPIQQAWDVNDERGKATADCKEIARWLKVPVVVLTQAATEVEGKQAKGKRAGKLDVYGSKAQVHVANTFLIITEQGRDETQTDREDIERDMFWLVDCKKGRDGPPFSFRARHSVRDGRITEIMDETAQVFFKAAKEEEETKEEEVPF